MVMYSLLEVIVKVFVKDIMLMLINGREFLHLTEELKENPHFIHLLYVCLDLRDIVYTK